MMLMVTIPRLFVFRKRWLFDWFFRNDLLLCIYFVVPGGHLKTSQATKRSIKHVSNVCIFFFFTSLFYRCFFSRHG